MTQLPPAASRPAVPTAVEIASDYMRTLIFTGVRRAGDRIQIDEIAKVLGVSRQPIREAIISMAADGLAVTAPKRGTYVGWFGRDIVLEHFDLYGLLASRAAARLAATRSESVVARLKDLDRRANEVSDTGELLVVLAQFQGIVHYGAATPRLAALLRSVERFVPGGFYLEAVPKGIEEARRSLRAIVGAVDKHATNPAADAVMDQWRTAGLLLTEELDRRGVFSEPDSRPDPPPRMAPRKTAGS